MLLLEDLGGAGSLQSRTFATPGPKNSRVKPPTSRLRIHLASRRTTNSSSGISFAIEVVLQSRRQDPS